MTSIPVKSIIIDTAAISGLELVNGGSLNQNTLIYGGAISAGHQMVTKNFARNFIGNKLSLDSTTNNLLADAVSLVGLQYAANKFYYGNFIDWKAMIIRAAAVLGIEYIAKV